MPVFSPGSRQYIHVVVSLPSNAHHWLHLLIFSPLFCGIFSNLVLGLGLGDLHALEVGALSLLSLDGADDG